MALLKIVYAFKNTAAFSIGEALYYIKMDGDFPFVYDKNLKKLVMPNIDYWLQAQTKQRYGLRSLRDMISAFKDGIQYSYDEVNLASICETVFDNTISYVFKTNHGKDFAKAFWIECLDENKIRKLTSTISDEFDLYHDKYGESFYNFLNRLWQYYMYHIPSEAAIIVKMIGRLGMVPQKPDYPTPTAELIIKSQIVTEDLVLQLNKLQGLDKRVKENVARLQAGRL